MTIITQGNSSTGTLNYLDSVTVEAGSGFASFESPSGTVLAQFSGARTFGPYSNRTYRVVAILGDIKYSINDDFPSGSVVQSVPVMGASGTITGLRNPDGTVTSLTGGSTTFTALADAVTAPIATTNTSVASAIAAVVANDLTTSATVAPSKDAVNAALAFKANILGPIGLGTGAIALTAAAHANHSCGWTGTTDQTITIDTTGGTVGDIYEISHDGASGILTFPGVAAAGYTLSFGAGVVGQVEWRGGTTFRSLIPNPSAASAPVTVTGSPTSGSVLTRTLGSGWTETGGNWTRDGTNISGATSSTYTTVSGDGGHTVTWKSSTIPYIPTGIAVAAAAPVFTAQSAPGGTVGTSYSYTFVATGAVSYAVASGAVPLGLSLNTGTGVLSGTPTTAAAYTFVISATNTGGTTNSTSQSVTIISAVYRADNFNRADAGSVGTSSHGEAWGYDTGGSSFAMGITSNKAVPTNSSSASYCNMDTGQTAYTLSADVTLGTDYPALLFRCADSDYFGDCMFVEMDPYGGLSLKKRVGGGNSTLGSYASGYSTGGTYSLAITVDGSSNITVKLDGVSRITATDTALAANTRVALKTGSVGAATLAAFDNFLVAP